MAPNMSTAAFPTTSVIESEPVFAAAVRIDADETSVVRSTAERSESKASAPSVVASRPAPSSVTEPTMCRYHPRIVCGSASTRSSARVTVETASGAASSARRSPDPRPANMLTRVRASSSTQAENSA